MADRVKVLSIIKRSGSRSTIWIRRITPLKTREGELARDGASLSYAAMPAPDLNACD
jgi:hypothetical protein